MCVVCPYCALYLYTLCTLTVNACSYMYAAHCLLHPLYVLITLQCAWILSEIVLQPVQILNTPSSVLYTNAVAVIYVHIQTFRHPATSERPSASSVLISLTCCDLSLEESDCPANSPLALWLGAPLEAASQLYPDLQKSYLPRTNDDYEEMPWEVVDMILHTQTMP